VFPNHAVSFSIGFQIHTFSYLSILKYVNKYVLHEFRFKLDNRIVGFCNTIRFPLFEKKYMGVVEIISYLLVKILKQYNFNSKSSKKKIWTKSSFSVIKNVPILIFRFGFFL